MRASSVAILLAACLSGISAADDAAPQCAVDCASGIRNAIGSLDLKAICADKLRTNVGLLGDPQYPSLYTSVSSSTNACSSQSLFQCLIGSCPQDSYGLAVAHVVLACSSLGLSIGPLFPVQVQHIDMEKPSYHPTPSLPAAYGTPSDDDSPQNAQHLTLSLDISLDLKCNSGPDGLVTVSLPPPAPSASPAPSPAPTPAPAPAPAPAPSPSPAPPSPPTPDAENGQGDGDDGSGNDNGGNNGSEKPTISSSPPEQTPTKPDPADPAATSSCPPDSVPSSVQAPGDGNAPQHAPGDGNAPGDEDAPGDDNAPGDEDAPGDEHAPPQSTELGEHGDPAVTPAPSPTRPNEDDPESPSSETPCSTASSDAPAGSDPEDAQDASQPAPSPSPTQETSDLPNDGDKPEVSATSDVDGMPGPAPVPVPASPTPAPASSPCSTTNGADKSVDAIPASQTPQPAESTTPAAQASPPPAATSSAEPQPLPLPSPPSYQTSHDSGDDAGNAPPEHAPSGDSGQSPGGENPSSANAEPLPQETHTTEADEPSSYGQESQAAPAPPVPVPASQTKDLAVQGADGKPTGKTTEPSEITLWPTATSNHSLCTTGPAKEGASPTTSCKTDGKRTTVHPPRSNLPAPLGDNQQNEPLGSAMIKIIRPGDQSAETLLTTFWENVVPATALSGQVMESHASATRSGTGSNPTATSTANAGHGHIGLVTSRPKPNHSSAQPNGTAEESSTPRVALVSSDSKPTPYFYMMALLVALTS